MYININISIFYKCKIPAILLLCHLLFLSFYSLSQNESNPVASCSEVKAQLKSLENRQMDNTRLDEMHTALAELINTATKDSCSETLIECYRLQAKLYSQQNDLDNIITSSLKAIALAEKNSLNAVIPSIQTELADTYFLKGVFTKASEYYRLAYEGNEQLNNISSQTYLLENIGLSSYNSSNYNQSQWAFKTLLERSDELNVDNTQIVRVLYQLLTISKEIKEFGNALTYSKKLHEIMQNEGDSLGQMLMLNNIGYLHFMNNDLIEAQTFFTKALEASKMQAVSNSLMANIYSNLGVCNQNLNNYTKAVDNLRNALAFLIPDESSEQYAKVLNTLAWVYYKKGDLYNASKRSKESLIWAKLSSNPTLLAECYKTYSILLKAGNDPIAALEYFEKYSQLRDSVALEQRITDKSSDDLLARLEKTEKEQKLYIADKEMQELMLKQLRLESEKRKQEIVLLRREGELQQLEKEKAYQTLELTEREHQATLQQSTIKNLEQSNAIKEYQIKQNEAEEEQRQKEIKLLQLEKERQQLEIEKETEIRKRAIWMLVLSFLVLTIVVIGLLTTRKKNSLLALQKVVIEQKNVNLENANKDILEKNHQLSELAEEIRAQNEEITTQKELIEDKNKKITDSIQYASLIQSAVLPDEELLSRHFTQSFVLYKPRDIVSGDFWWFRKTNERTILAVADCTGHGVPGAFLSMLGSTLLTEIGNQFPAIRANELLDELQARLVNALVHENRANPQRDGMDIAVCIFNDKTNEIEFSGAYNPVYILRDEEIIVVKGDKIPIGFRERESLAQGFTLKIIKYLPNDRFFLFSDGYADQFGGDNNRKLMYHNFRKLLIESRRMSMDKQKEFMDESFAKWQGYSEQIDDVMVVGVQV